MRILFLSDVHANWPALQAVRESFDVCLFLGDLVDYGLEPTPCIEWMRERMTYGVRGNHDHGAAQGVMINGVGGYRYLSGLTRSMTCEMLDEPNRRFLASLPTTQCLTLDDKRYMLVHATPRDPMDEYGPQEEEFWQRRLEGIDVDYVLCGHTHQPYTLQVGKTLIVNPGSVGLPRDGDPRAGYGIIEGGRVELCRVEYPIDRTLATLHASALPDKAKEMLAEVYRHGRLPNGKHGK